MGATINVNGSPTRSVVVPFGATVSLTNSATSGVASQKWELLAPLDLSGNPPDYGHNFAGWTVNTDGTLSIDQTGSYPAVTFNPDVTGGYEIRLTATPTVGSPVIQTAVITVPESYSGDKVPASGESNEADTTRGWSAKRNQSIKAVLKRMGKGAFVRVANLTVGTLTRGQVVRLSDFVDVHTMTPNVNPGGTTVQPEMIPSVVVGHANDSGAANSRYAVVDDTSIPPGDTGWAQISGPFDGDYSAYSDGAPIYVSNAGAQSPTPGASLIIVGHVIKPTSSGAAFIQCAGAPSVSTGGSGGGQPIVDDDVYSDSSGNEVLYTQLAVNLTSNPALSVVVNLAMLAAASAGTSTFRVYLGGTINTIDGTLVGTMTANSPTLSEKGISLPVSNPGGLTLLKITIQSDLAGHQGTYQQVTGTIG